jgi:para-aminobenzoate synthetase component I
MQEQTGFIVSDIEEFKQKALQWAEQFPVFICLDSNQYPHDTYATHEWLLAIDALESVECTVGNVFESLKAFSNKKKDTYTFGFLSYDVKNEVENLQSANPDQIGLPDLFFFEPRYLIRIQDGKAFFNRNYPEAFHLFDTISNMPLQPLQSAEKITLQNRVSKENYLKNVQAIRNHIEEGDVYEMNYCIEFFAENVNFHPLSYFNTISQMAKAPMSALVKKNDTYIMCASPERFLKKKGNKLISQPIKGTIKKGQTEDENTWFKARLYYDMKERAENVMIVDLVRNDLTKSAVPGSIEVEELFKIYEFATINQMISTVSATLNESTHPIDAIKNAYPMGSMTGAPKVKAMQLIEQFETTKRGVYSGTIGYLAPGQDYDFNVVIRSLIYHSEKKYLSLQVGGAITYDSKPEKEYEEIMVKAKAIMDVLNKTHQQEAN